MTSNVFNQLAESLEKAGVDVILVSGEHGLQRVIIYTEDGNLHVTQMFGLKKEGVTIIPNCADFKDVVHAIQGYFLMQLMTDLSRKVLGNSLETELENYRVKIAQLGVVETAIATRTIIPAKEKPDYFLQLIVEMPGNSDWSWRANVLFFKK